ncbi:MAG: hypothetical protein ACYTBZ_13280 [Planctomycetota bacterium]|jgi:uncharacterized membrane protein
MPDRCPVCDKYLQTMGGFCDRCGFPISVKYKNLPKHYRDIIITRRLVLINCIVCALLMFSLVNPIPATVGGSVIIISAIVLIIAGRRIGYTGAWRLGIFQCVACLVIASLSWLTIFNLNLVIMQITLVMACFIVHFIASLLVWKNHPWLSIHKRFECKQCGYLLFGLITPRCPECGTKFNPALLEMVSNLM